MLHPARAGAIRGRMRGRGIVRGLAVRGLAVLGLSVRGLAIRGLVIRGLALLGFLVLAPAMHGAGAADVPRIAVFDFDIINTSLEPTTPVEQERARQLGAQLRAMLAGSLKYDVVDIATLRPRIAAGTEIRNCNGCERDLARLLGADLAAVAWVQKVSNLILNVNVVIEDAKTGAKLAGGSVDIRGNTDESWQRGLSYLVRNQILDR